MNYSGYNLVNYKIIGIYFDESYHLPTSNDILKVLGIQDGNIEFKDNCVNYNLYKRKRCKFIEGKLTYTPTACAKCQAQYKNYSLYRNETQLSRITLPMSGFYPTYILLKKQRFMCKSCRCILQLFCTPEETRMFSWTI